MENVKGISTPMETNRTNRREDEEVKEENQNQSPEQNTDTFWENSLTWPQSANRISLILWER